MKKTNHWFCAALLLSLAYNAYAFDPNNPLANYDPLRKGRLLGEKNAQAQKKKDEQAQQQRQKQERAYLNQMFKQYNSKKDTPAATYTKPWKGDSPWVDDNAQTWNYSKPATTKKATTAASKPQQAPAKQQPKQQQPSYNSSAQAQPIENNVNNDYIPNTGNTKTGKQNFYY